MTIFLFVGVAVLGYWLTYRVFTADSCEFFGSKIALVVVPACMALGNRGAATLPFLLASLSLLLGIKGLLHHANITGRFKA
jgi:hypothetical protein